MDDNSLLFMLNRCLSARLNRGRRLTVIHSLAAVLLSVALCSVVEGADSVLSRPGDSGEIEKYCQAMNMSTLNCAALERIRFSGSGSTAMLWDPEHTVGVTADDSGSVASPAVGASGHSCMSFHLNPPIEAGDQVSSYWFVAGPDSNRRQRSSVLRLYYAPEDGHMPEHSIGSVSGSALIQKFSAGLELWEPHTYQHAISAAPISEFKWCFWGGSTPPKPGEIGRVDRFAFGSDRQQISNREGLMPYCTALNMRAEHCDRLSQIVFTTIEPILAGDFWDYAHMGGAPVGGGAYSLSAPRSGRGTRNCMSLYFDPPFVAGTELRFQWSAPNFIIRTRVSRNQLGLWLNPGMDHEPRRGSMEEENLFPPTGSLGSWDQYSSFISEELSELKWCYFGNITPPRVQDIARVDTLDFLEPELSPEDVEQYCMALNMPAWNCELIYDIRFTGGSDDSAGRWVVDHPFGSPAGRDSISVASPRVAAGDYSCMSLLLKTPLAAGSSLRFSWSAGRSGGVGTSRMQLRLDPGPGDVPTAAAGALMIVGNADGFGTWESYSVAEIAAPVEVVRWCYLGANPQPGIGDIGRLDALRFGPYTSEVAARNELAEYCTAAGLEGGGCTALSRIVFSGTAPADTRWARAPNPSPGGTDTFGALLSPPLNRGEESCMRMEFSVSAKTAIRRVIFRWSLTGPAAGRLRVYRDGEAEPALEFIRSEAGTDGELSIADLWLPRSPEPPNLALRWCYHLPASAAVDAAGSEARITGISVRQQQPSLTVEAPTADNLDAESALHRVHNLRVGAELLHDSTRTLRDDAVLSMLTAVSVVDMVYWMPADALVPFAWEVAVTA